ncbi:transglycosylase SLT domain-containing protein [Fibrella sp. HMF5335]|uniref:Transglycosylase SLT domain-containing protein n=2 Tax=Fibrella rubiginis TaxID=2817060 RepID=A0A939GCZ9_9BACT|nr:transglycosylase SLT domain-containing protein [Fibrella rubiginis]
MSELMKRVTQVGYGLAVAASLLIISPVRAQVADSSVVDSTFIVEEVLNLPTIPEATLRERLPKLQRQIPLPYNKVVHNFIDYFTYRKPSYTRMVMERMPFYFPMYEKTLAKYNMPDELKYLSIVESALNPRAVSRVGAGGLWQFMPYTGKDFKLNIDDYTDDRMDPQKATDAACRYLKELYGTFGDWEMALAAYNCGPGAVRRAMRRSGGTTFWTCYDFLPKETRSYVPQFIAIAYMMNYGPDHGIVAEHPDYPIAFDTVQVNSYLDLKTFADLSQMPLADLRKLNPAISTDRLPDYTRDFVLRVPSERMHHFQSNRRMIMDSASKLPVLMANMLLAHSEEAGSSLDSANDPAHWRVASRLADAVPVSAVVVAENDPAGAGQALPEPDDLETVVMRKPKKQSHTVRRGETLSEIAERYHVDTYDLKQWNHLHSKTVKVGQKLTILREAGETHTERMAKQDSPKNHRKAETTARHERERPRYHRVQSGDTLWNIAQRYGLLSIDKLKKINHIKGNSVRPGQKLLVG